jgi:UDP-3-O-[3-hydroxymyristoyl] glucosamine N-acyltransferase
MPDPRFFVSEGPFTLGELAARIGAEIAGRADPGLVIDEVGPLETAGPHTLSFLENRKYVDQFERSLAGAALVHPDLAGRAPRDMALLLSPNPYKDFAHIAALFYPEPKPPAAVAASAVIHPTARIGEGCSIGPHVVIGEEAEIGNACRIDANTVIGPHVVIGEACWIGANAVISHSIIGNHVRLYPGVCIGQDGFGFAPDPQGHIKVPQLGRVRIEDRVEIGANTTIDRGAGPDTVIGAGTIIDNLVQIGHNVVVGRGCILVAQTGISGSTKLGDFVMIGGQGGLAGHLNIGKGARIAAKSGVMRDIAEGETVCGHPAVPMAEFFRQIAILRRLTKRRGD